MPTNRRDVLELFGAWVAVIGTGGGIVAFAGTDRTGGSGGEEESPPGDSAASGGAPSGTPPPETTTPAGTPAAESTPTPTPAPATATAAETPAASAGSVTIEGKEWAFVPEEVTAVRGQPFDITFENVGTVTHNLTIGAFEQKTETIEPGSTDTLSFTPDEAGEFPYWCDVAGHRQAGMEGTLIVKPPSGGSGSTSTPTRTPADSGDAAATAVTVEGKEWAFSPDEIRVSKGEPVTITFENVGTVTHNLTVGAFDQKTETIEPGATDTISFTPDEAGEFPYWCDVAGHRQAGMEGTLVVEA